MADQGEVTQQDPRMRRDLAALILIAIGACGLDVAAWLTAPLAGVAVTAALVLVLGVALGLDR